MAGVALAMPAHGGHEDVVHSDAALLQHLPLEGQGFWLALLFLATGSCALFYGFLQQVLYGHAVTGQG